MGEIAVFPAPPLEHLVDGAAREVTEDRDCLQDGRLAAAVGPDEERQRAQVDPGLLCAGERLERAKAEPTDHPRWSIVERAKNGVAVRQVSRVRCNMGRDARPQLERARTRRSSSSKRSGTPTSSPRRSRPSASRTRRSCSRKPLAAAIARQNPWLSDDNVQKAVRAVTHEQRFAGGAGPDQLSRRPGSHLPRGLRCRPRAHARAPSESHPEFWAALGRVMPDYDARKARLRALGPLFDW